MFKHLSSIVFFMMMASIAAAQDRQALIQATESSIDQLARLAELAQDLPDEHTREQCREHFAEVATTATALHEGLEEDILLPLHMGTDIDQVIDNLLNHMETIDEYDHLMALCRQPDELPEELLQTLAKLQNLLFLLEVDDREPRYIVRCYAWKNFFGVYVESWGFAARSTRTKALAEAKREALGSCPMNCVIEQCHGEPWSSGSELELSHD